MRNYLLSFLFISSSALAIDPFFGEKSHMKNESDAIITKNLEKLTACQPLERKSHLNLEADFEKLKLIGIININQNFSTLFIDEKEQLFEFKETDLINKEIEIKNINLKSITYINWKLTQDCNMPYEITLKL
ncbi:hypothetical protein [Mannheimia pernigra]|uniref:hypothetical protein n=1 Tax=Mannheimia pernigra TaxID=111844 RepID=UPI001318E906|nr:hypothetical protein [Mannheimia pernigra]QHB17437.1 hypothetical protein GM695_05050 [Mannheimia pernigra]